MPPAFWQRLNNACTQLPIEEKSGLPPGCSTSNSPEPCDPRIRKVLPGNSGFPLSSWRSAGCRLWHAGPLLCLRVSLFPILPRVPIRTHDWDSRQWASSPDLAIIGAYECKKSTHRLRHRLAGCSVPQIVHRCLFDGPGNGSRPGSRRNGRRQNSRGNRASPASGRGVLPSRPSDSLGHQRMSSRQECECE